MTSHQPTLPHESGRLFLTDAGLETDMIFNRGHEIPAFASHTLLENEAGRTALAQYFSEFLNLAQRHGTGFVLDCPTWRAQSAYARALGTDDAGLAAANRQAVAFGDGLRASYASTNLPVVLNGLIGPRHDAYAPRRTMTCREAEDYHRQQLGWLSDTLVDMVSGLTFAYVEEAIGVVRAARGVGLPVVMSFTVETDGRLPSGTPLAKAIRDVDDATDQAAAYFMVNCAHPDHFRDALLDIDAMRRVRGFRCNASRCSHAELDQSDTLDDGDPREFGELYAELVRRMPWVNVLGGCCGSDLRHVAAVAAAVAWPAATAATAGR